MVGTVIFFACFYLWILGDRSGDLREMVEPMLIPIEKSKLRTTAVKIACNAWAWRGMFMWLIAHKSSKDTTGFG